MARDKGERTPEIVLPWRPDVGLGSGSNDLAVKTRAKRERISSGNTGLRIFEDRAKDGPCAKALSLIMIRSNPTSC